MQRFMQKENEICLYTYIFFKYLFKDFLISAAYMPIFIVSRLEISRSGRQRHKKRWSRPRSGDGHGGEKHDGL